MLACASAAVACGPEFPNSYYSMPEAELLAAPRGLFESEIARIAQDIQPQARAVRFRRPLAGIEKYDLQQALLKRGMTLQRAVDIARAFEVRRQEVDTWVRQTEPSTDYSPTTQRRFTPPNFDESPLPSEVPKEFAEYFAGALAWHRGDLAIAQQHWEAILALPAEERRYRSTWAAFMLGRARAREVDNFETRREDSLVEAKRYFALVRQMTTEGYPDPLGLAAESLGWEARACLKVGDKVGALELYLEHYATGDETALLSLRFAARASAEYKGNFAKLATSSVARRIVTAYFISRHEARWFDRSTGGEEDWASALRDANVRELPEADRLAWLAYDAGLFPLAWQWIELAEQDSPEAQWVRAKLALRGGNLQAGEKSLRAALASPRLAEEHRVRVAAELSRVCLARDDFAGALSASLKGGHWEDVAFVAERVMSLGELTQYLDSEELPVPAPSTSYWLAKKDLRARLHHLAARRLVRAGKTELAERYFPPELRVTFRHYVGAVKLGFDVTQPDVTRAGAFWHAAEVIHQHGMELLGTELEPDWAIWEGEFNLTPSVQQRRAGIQKDEAKQSLFRPTALESERLEKQPGPEKRFQYRYRAAELAWWAASLSPNDSEETARMLATAGGWLKYRDPEAAKPFYQALVIRCGNTPLGRAAAEVHWFPKPKADLEKPEL